MIGPEDIEFQLGKRKFNNIGVYHHRMRGENYQKLYDRYHEP
jgi:hypothetical protein